MIRWKPVPGATHYRVAIRSRVPEGAVLFVTETNVSDPEFMPPKPLASGTAVVTVNVVPVCSGGEGRRSSAATEHRFYIDARPTCRISSPPVVEKGPDGRRLTWPSSTAADRYEVFAYSATDGTTLFVRETRDNVLLLASEDVRRVAYVVRPRCGPVTGVEAYLVN